MRILAVCDERYADATRKVVGEGAVVITSPPVFAADFSPAWLEGRDLVYLDLHGQPGSGYLYSGPEQEWAALSFKTVRAARMPGAVVFAASCYLPQTPFLRVFLLAGAAVVAGQGVNYGTRRRLSGAQHLARYLIQELEKGQELEAAFQTAKARLARRLGAWLREPKETADTLRFRLWRGTAAPVRRAT